MPEIQRPELVTLLRQRFGLRGIAAFGLAPEIVPVAIVDDIQEQADDPTIIRQCIGYAQVTNVAGQYSQIWCGLPAASSVTAGIHTVFVNSETDGSILIGPYDLTTHGSAVTTKAMQDRRNPGSPVMMIQQAAAAGLLPNPSTTHIAVEAVSGTMIPLNAVLGPGDGLIFAYSPTNAILRCTFMWSERES